MTRFLLLLMLLAAATICTAQIGNGKTETGDKDQPTGGRKAKPKPVVQREPTLSVAFTGNHAFYLVKDDKDHGDRISKDSTVRMPLKKGRYRFVFEEADSTGERIVQDFVVTQEMINRKDSTLIINFKNDFVGVKNMAPAAPATEQKVPEPPSKKKKKN